MGKYSDEKNVQILIALLKKHGIRKVVASPGGTNISFVGSVQNDAYFEVYSAVDERHAAYLACGMAQESNSPIVLSCTGATASRNYLPALTEAFYRKLPILVVTSSQVNSRIGNLVPQVTDRRQLPADVVNHSVLIEPVKDAADASLAGVLINGAILALDRRGGGPSHINIETEYVQTFETESLPDVNKIDRIDVRYIGAPELPPHARVAIWIGAHRRFSTKEREVLNRFVRSRNVAVFCDHTSSYTGANKVLSALPAVQSGARQEVGLQPDILITIGEVSGDYSTRGFLMGRGQEWRVSPDGEIRNVCGRLRYVFEMPEIEFFNHFAPQDGAGVENHSYFSAWQTYSRVVRSKVPELPFSNAWIAQRLANRIPQGSTVHFAILNSLRSWNNFELPNDVNSSCNVGGFGIDGCLSSLVGASFCDANHLYFCITGDLAFFYDLNALGNRHIGKNLRILLVNNGEGAEFKRFERVKCQLGVEGIESYVAAKGHYASCSRHFVRHLAEDLGFGYLCADSKDGFEEKCNVFVSSSEKPILFECFTCSEDDVRASLLLEKIDDRMTLKGCAAKVLPPGLRKVIRGVCGK